ncbi:hypothetical protein IW261DRAFT_1428574 [Armillaria novae-zelandiae]|uniref:Uncharacterized protein n=1 Tax=Armillaria novae-zelandiae TaxID=153914 RepID=A0AA39N9G9_9AGAR|nr:hypothetical protein IW261DRAFT_1428574 [Armillaria novae-zelandiae]
MVTIKNKKHRVLKAHTYEKEEPVPVKAEELDTITQAAALPSYGCTQCSSSIQNQPCLFLGWGKQCNNCEAASKSLCTFRAEPVQCYFARKELAKCVEATPKTLLSTSLRAAPMLLLTRLSYSEPASRSFPRSAPMLPVARAGTLFLAWFSRIVTLKTESAPLFRSLFLVEREPSLPLDPGPSSLPAFTAIVQVSSPSDSLVDGDEVQGELNELESLPIRPAPGESATAA